MDPEEWITNSNDCFHINLVRPSASGKSERILDEPFNPAFTYPIFGEEESILGYKEPQITLDFNANDLKPSLQVKHKGKIDLSGILPGKQQDLNAMFDHHLPPAAFGKTSEGAVSVPDPTSNSWKPPGNLVQSFALHEKQYEIWRTSFADPVAKELWQNMEILVLLFIEGASQLELDEEWSLERWTLYLMYEVTPLKGSSASPYTIAGFSTSYRYWIFPTFEVMRSTNSLPSPPESTNGNAQTYTPPRLAQDPDTFLFTNKLDPLEAPSRERISQFVILPPYQGQSLGAKLYETIFEDLVKKPNIYEIAVEDPNEAFDAMRDYCDIAYLRTLSSFKALSLVSSLPPENLRRDSPVPRDLILGNGADLTALRHKAKIVPRQFNRMVELHLLSTIPLLSRNKARISRKDKSSNENDRKYYFWRLALKDRIYRQNADVLDQLEDPKERVETVEKAVDGQQEEYKERLEGIEKREKWAVGEDAQNGESSRSKRKRAIIEDEDDEWEDIEEESVASSKKMKR